MDIHNTDNQEPDAPRQLSPSPVIQWITAEDASALLESAGLPRNNRTIRRYCARGDLDCRKTENAQHQPQYFIDARSVETYIDQQKTLMSLGLDGSRHVQSQLDETGLGSLHLSVRAADVSAASLNTQTPLGPAATGQNWIGPGGELLDQLQARLVDKDEEIKFLRSELQHRRTTDTALHDVIAAFRANAEAQRLSAGQQTPDGQGTTHRQPPIP